MNLVTGATGFIGSNVVKSLLKRGERVRVLVRKKSNLDNLKELEVEYFYGDLLDKDSLLKAMHGVRRVFHVGAMYVFWAKKPEDFYTVNVLGTHNILESAKKKDVERVIYTSTMATMGGGDGKTLRNENSEFNLTKTFDHYIISKFLAEKQVLDFAKKNSLDVVIVNPSGPLGRGDIKPTPTGKLLVEFLNGNIPGYMDGGINLVNVKDVAEGHILASLKGKTGERYLLTNKNLTIKETFQLFSDVTGLPSPKIKLPYFAGFLLAIALESFAKVTRTEPLLTKSNIRASKFYFYFDNSKAKNELGLEFTPIEEGIKEAILYFIERGFVGKERAKKVLKFFERGRKMI